MAVSEGKIIEALENLVAELKAQWDPEKLFSVIMQTYGTAKSSVQRALKNDPAVNVALTEVTDDMEHCDVAIRQRAYFRFVKDPDQVEKALNDVADYLEAKSDKTAPRFVVAASAKELCMYDFKADEFMTLALEDLPRNYNFLLPMTGAYEKEIISSKHPADVKACLKLTKLLDMLAERNNLKDEGYHKLNVFIERLLFCLFAEDTEIFPVQDQFSSAFASLTSKQGEGAEKFFHDLFTVLNTPEDRRDELKSMQIAPAIMKFPYVNGGLFKEDEFIPKFDEATRRQMVDCGKLSWKSISPAIFGAMFQNVMDEEERHTLGAHYTSEENIFKLIKPLFLDELTKQVMQAIENYERETARNESRGKNKKSKNELLQPLFELQNKLASLNFLDPACGCGNFLLITYRELRRLENRLIHIIYADGIITVEDVVKVSIDQFYGIELEDWPAEIAHLAMWLMQHQMNQETSEMAGEVIPSIPLKHSATIVCANALTKDWNEVLKAEDCDYILGNPPYGGTTYTTEEQKKWLKAVYPPKYKLGYADFVTGWFVKASDYMRKRPSIEAAFVATNSICQGEQVAILWGLLFSRGFTINFAYKSFLWSNEARNKAAVTCVIVGFGLTSRPVKVLYTVHKDGEGKGQFTSAISPYLTAQPPVFVNRQSKALSAPLPLVFGNKPADGGYLIFEQKRREEVLKDHQELAPFVKHFIGSSELINGTRRACLWLREEECSQWECIPEIMRHVEQCRAWRSQQKETGAAFKFRSFPWRFGQIANPANPSCALVIPRVSSQRRQYIPMGVIDGQTIVGDSAFIIPDISLEQNLDVFGVLSSRMHMQWMKLTCGRMKSDYRYSRDLCYNTFIWPNLNEMQRQEIDELAFNILDIRAGFDMTLAELYNPETMPLTLKVAHEKLDLAVEKAYRTEPFADDDERVEFLLNLYAEAVKVKGSK